MNSQTPALTLTPTERSIVDLNLPDITATREPMPEAVPEPPRELSPFERRANPMIERNQSVIPLMPGTKIAFLSNWQGLATRDVNTTKAWSEIDYDEHHGDFNAACVAHAVIGGTWFFDADDLSIIKRIENETGKKLPRTFTVASSPGKAHLYFNQSLVSIKMGNAQGKDAEGKEAWSARVDDRYVASAGSVHPTYLGADAYTITDDSPIVNAPDWLIEWCVKNAVSETGRVNASPDGPPIPRGSHDNELFRIACMLRGAGMDYQQILDNLIQICGEALHGPWH